MFKLIYSILYFVLMALILVICFKSFGQQTINAKGWETIYSYNGVDTTKPKKGQYWYFLRHETEISEYVPAIDTVNMVINEIGRSMSVDESRIYQMTLRRNLQKLIGKVTRDSVLIK